MKALGARPTTRCWEWNGYRNRSGYGQICRGSAGRKRQILVHRMIWERVNGPIPEGLIIMHHCDNRACFRPSHLSAGTHADNALDRDLKGRTYKPGPEWADRMHRRGEEHSQAKLTLADVDEIRRLLRQGIVQRRIAERFGVSPATITNIKKQIVWRPSCPP